MKGAALVTGSGKRVGRALAQRLAEAGYPVIIHGRHADDDTSETADLIRKAGGRAEVVAADLSDRSALAPLIFEASQPFGPLEVLVNSASVFQDDRMGQITPESWDLHIASNLFAPIMLAQAFAMQVDGLSSNADPSIVNMLDQRVLKPNPQFFSYSLAKAALHWATTTMAQALAPKVRVNGVGPGPTLPSIHQTEESFAAEAQATLLARASRPEDLADGVLYLIGARAVTGQLIAVDAGQHLNWRTADIEA